MYILANDRVGNRTLDLLESARKVGKQVYLVYDGLGSLTLSLNTALKGSM